MGEFSGDDSIQIFLLPLTLVLVLDSCERFVNILMKIRTRDIFAFYFPSLFPLDFFAVVRPNFLQIRSCIECFSQETFYIAAVTETGPVCAEISFHSVFYHCTGFLPLVCVWIEHIFSDFENSEIINCKS